MQHTRVVVRHLPTIYCRSTHTSTGRLASASLPASSFELPESTAPDHGSPVAPQPPLARLPTTTVVRSWALATLMGQSWLMKPSLAALGFLSHTKIPFLNPDKNFLLNRVMRMVLYDHFCAGANIAEVARSSRALKDMGYKGVVLGYAKEVVLPHNGKSEKATKTDYTAAEYDLVRQWKDGTLHTLNMMTDKDLLAIKLTGAGPIAVDAMKAHQPMPKVIADAMEEICQKTKAQGARLWIDAEQQAVQYSLDNWTIDLMRKHNRGPEPLVYNTIQAYLKGAEANAERHISLAAKEGWTVAIKLVRGAYIENEVRSLIHDTKEDSDRAYDNIADMFLSQRMPASDKGTVFPKSALFLATHNAPSAEKAFSTYRQRASVGLPTTGKLECVQLQGMADELSCSLLQKQEECGLERASGMVLNTSTNKNVYTPPPPPPGIYKSQPWGSVSECLGYLHRRAIENRGAVAQMDHMRRSFAQEIQRRIFG